MSYFYLTESPSSSNGTYFKTMETLKKKMRQFYCVWTKYNSPNLSLPRSFKNHVLVVADEVFQMTDA